MGGIGESRPAHELINVHVFCFRTPEGLTGRRSYAVRLYTVAFVHVFQRATRVHASRPGKNTRTPRAAFTTLDPGGTVLPCGTSSPRDPTTTDALVPTKTQVSIATARSDAERARREFEARRRAEQEDIQDRLVKELARLQRELAAAKAKAATDISRAQVREIVFYTVPC